MKNVLRIFRRDALRLLRVPAAWVIALGLVVIPCLYAWFNILGFWDPYSNTKEIRVAVANQDQGTHSELLGDINLGAQIVEQLKTNDKLGWHFVGEDEAIREVEAGESYAAIVIPPSISADLDAAINGNQKLPALKYYVNEKANAISTKITDAGGSLLEQQINTAFVSTASKAVSEMINQTKADVSERVGGVVSGAIDDLETVQGNVAKSRSLIQQADSSLSDLSVKTKDMRNVVGVSGLLLNQANDQLSRLSGVLDSTQSGITEFAGSSSAVLDKGGGLLSSASAKVNVSVSKVIGALTIANSKVGSGIDTLNNLTDENDRIIAGLIALNRPELQPIIDQLKQENDNLKLSIAGLKQMNSHVGTTISDTAAAADKVNEVTQSSITASADMRSKLNGEVLPQLNKGLSTLSSATAILGNGAGGQQSLLSQLNGMLGRVDQIADTTRSALAQVDSGMSDMQDKLSQLSTDLNALSGSAALSQVLGAELDVSKIADFMQSPTVLDTNVWFPVMNYGSGMAPLFTNLSLWVGAFVLMVIVKLEVDDEGLSGLTPTQRYLGRWLLLACFAMAQGVTVTIGELIIGIQVASPPVFVLTAVIASLVYLSIVYALSTAFQHVGKGVCVAAVVLQIPGASGLYPIEMMPKFFRVIYPLFPFTHSINAFRETIGGFYDHQCVKSIGILLLFAVIFFALGLLVRPRLFNVNHLFSRELQRTGMAMVEPVQGVDRRLPLSQTLAILADRDEYRLVIENKAKRFAVLYPKMKKGALVAGIVVPAVLVVVFTKSKGTEVFALAAWIAWVLIMIGFLMAFELTRDSIERQAELGTLSDQDIHGMFQDYEDRRLTRLSRRDRPVANLLAKAKFATSEDTSPADDGKSSVGGPETVSDESGAEGADRK